MHPEEKIDLITQNLEEIIGLNDLNDLIKERSPVVYWGTATTGKPHIAYLVPLLKIRDFLLAGCHVKILLADLHAVLDNLKTPIALIKERVKYYSLLIKTILSELIDDSLLKNVTFVIGSSFQKSEEYVYDLYRLSTLVSEHDSKKAGSEVVKQTKNIKLSSLIYPLMQALDEEYLKCDIQFGGSDQRKIFTLSMKYLPLLGYKKRIHLMNRMIEGLNSEKMSSSSFFGKIEFTESKEEIHKKIKKAFLEEKSLKGGLFGLLRNVLFPVLVIKKGTFFIKSINVTYDDINILENDYLEGIIHPLDLKNAIVEVIDFIIGPIRSVLFKNEEIIKEAYPNEE